MLVQLNRSDSHRTSTPSDIELPLAELVHEPAPPVVAVFGQRGRIAGLEAHLPAGWSIRAPRDLDDVRPDEIVLFTHAGGKRNWLEDGLVEQAKERFDTPVRHMVVE